MSRSNPQETGAPNPASLWFEWQGEKGVIRYYDKAQERRVEVAPPFRFILLDQLGAVGGWHDASKSRIYSNQVKDTRQDVLIVKAFKEGILAEGLYKEIKDRVTSKAVGGHFVANLYLAFKGDGGGLAIGCLQLKGSALGAWAEFLKHHRGDVYQKAVSISGYEESTKGGTTFRRPIFAISELSAESQAQAVALDRQLQEWLTGYLARTKRDQADAQPHQAAAHEPEPTPAGPSAITDEDIPF